MKANGFNWQQKIHQQWNSNEVHEHSEDMDNDSIICEGKESEVCPLTADEAMVFIIVQDFGW